MAHMGSYGITVFIMGYIYIYISDISLSYGGFRSHGGTPIAGWFMMDGL